MGTKRINRRRRGITLVQAVLVLPILLLITFGLIEYGFLFLKAQQLENTVRQAARTGALPDANNTRVNTLVSSMMTDARLQSSGYTVSITQYGSSTPVDVGAVSPGQMLSVTITIPYDNISITRAPLIPVPTQLKRTVTMAKEGP